MRRAGIMAATKAARSPSICLSCRRALAIPKLVPQGQMSRRALSTTMPRRAESIRPETYYDFFPDSTSGLPPQGSFTLDLKALRREFLQLQASAHPDRHSDKDKARAEALSARINEAYKTLQDPLKRAQYLLSLKGIDVAEDETLKVEDQSLLMSVMEAREEIEDAETEQDLESIKNLNDGKLNKSVAILEKAFEENDLETAKQEAVRLRYWTNIKESIDDWEPGKPVVLIH